MLTCNQIVNRVEAWMSSGRSLEEVTHAMRNTTLLCMLFRFVCFRLKLADLDRLRVFLRWNECAVLEVEQSPYLYCLLRCWRGLIRLNPRRDAHCAGQIYVSLVRCWGVHMRGMEDANQLVIGYLRSLL